MRSTSGRKAEYSRTGRARWYSATVRSEAKPCARPNAVWRLCWRMARSVSAFTRAASRTWASNRWWARCIENRINRRASRVLQGREDMLACFPPPTGGKQASTRRGFGGARQVHREGGAPGDTGAHRDQPPVRAYDLIHDVQAQPHAAARLVHIGGGAMQGLEQTPPLGGDGLAQVVDGQRHPTVLAHRLHAHRCIGRTVLEGVGDQVLDHLGDAVRVPLAL